MSVNVILLLLVGTATVILGVGIGYFVAVSDHTALS